MALASGGGIVATEAALMAAGRQDGADLREAELRGFSTPVRVATVGWS
jgi:class 3 adenylate cyclase